MEYDPEDYTILGIQNGDDPKQDFDHVEHASLSLHMMLYFANRNPDTYVRMVLGNSCKYYEHPCPLIPISLEIVKLLLDDILGLVGNNIPNDLKPSQNSILMKMTLSCEDILEVRRF